MATAALGRRRLPEETSVLARQAAGAAQPQAVQLARPKGRGYVRRAFPGANFRGPAGPGAARGSRS